MNDIKNINDKKLKSKIKEFIIDVENSKNLDDIVNIKKLKGYSTAYRCRIGDYRLGFYLNDDIIELARFVKRNDILQSIPVKKIYEYWTCPKKCLTFWGMSRFYII